MTRSIRRLADVAHLLGWRARGEARKGGPLTLSAPIAARPPAPSADPAPLASVKERRAFHQSARAERARHAAVLLDPAYQSHLLPAAVSLLATTNLTPDAIRTTLSAVPASAARTPGGLYDRMASRAPVRVGMDAPSASAGDFGAQMKAVIGKVRPAAQAAPAQPAGALAEPTLAPQPIIIGRPA